MKKILMLVLMVFVVGTIAMGQTLQEVVYLKNGSVIRGVIIEQIPNVSLEVQTADGSIFAYQMEEVEKITKEQVLKSTKTKSRSTYASNNYRMKSGYRGFVDGGYFFVIHRVPKNGFRGISRSNTIQLSTSHGYQISPYLFAGVGAGAIFRVDKGEDPEVPVFADIRGTLPCRSNCQPFLDFKIGYTVFNAKGFYMNPSIGCRFAISKWGGINVGVGYAMQKSKYKTLKLYSGDEIGALTFTVGMDF